jgi:cation diffusion facilitator CzcD-associated flavoprotein CzcO
VRVALKTDIVVIGAGQAGLSSAYHVKRRGLARNRGFVVLNQSPQPGGAWLLSWPPPLPSASNWKVPGAISSRRSRTICARRWPHYGS